MPPEKLPPTERVKSSQPLRRERGEGGDKAMKIKSAVSNPQNRAPARECASCGDLFAPHRRRDEARYCSKSCVWRASKGPEFNARIARTSACKRGDMLRNRGDGKSYRKLGGQHEHRAVAEKSIGRKLLRGEVVHHKDEDIRNNSPENLEVLPSQSEHAKIHFSGKRQSKEHIRKRVCSRRLNG